MAAKKAKLKKPKAKAPPPADYKVGPGKPPLHAQWKPGQSGNPSGYPGDPPEVKMFRNLTKKELVHVGNLVIKGDLDALKALAKKPGATVLQVMLAAVCIKVVSKGDMHSLDILLNRLVGKVRDEVHNTGSTDTRVVVMIPSNGRELKEKESA